MRTFSDELDFRVTDSSLRDGSHAKRHQFTIDDVQGVVAALDAAGVPVIEVSHGDGVVVHLRDLPRRRTAADRRRDVDGNDRADRCADAAGRRREG